MLLLLDGLSDGLSNGLSNGLSDGLSRTIPFYGPVPLVAREHSIAQGLSPWLSACFCR